MYSTIDRHTSILFVRVIVEELFDIGRNVFFNAGRNILHSNIMFRQLIKVDTLYLHFNRHGGRWHTQLSFFAESNHNNDGYASYGDVLYLCIRAFYPSVGCHFAFDTSKKWQFTRRHIFFCHAHYNDTTI